MLLKFVLMILYEFIKCVSFYRLKIEINYIIIYELYNLNEQIKVVQAMIDVYTRIE